MKRLISICFLMVFLFNVGGYYCIFWGLEIHSNKKLLQRIEADNISPNETVLLIIPLSLPYPVSHSGEYERISGEFQYQGESYTLVKQKVEQDTLFIVCVRDRESTHLTNAFSDYTKATHNLPISSKRALSFLSKLFKDFNSTEFIFSLGDTSFFDVTFFTHNAFAPIERSYQVEGPPPDLRF